MFFLLPTAFALSPAADPRPFGSLFGRRDTDNDGVWDSRDACKVLAETRNGYKDEDGCPDRLTQIAVAAWYRGVAVPDALLIADVDERRMTGRGELLVTELNPTHTVHLMATVGCLSSQASLELTERAQRIRLALHPTGTRPVTVRVQDSNSAPVPMSTVQWMSSSEAGCGAPESVLLDDGSAQLKIGNGQHTVEVTVRGRRQTVEGVLGPNDTVLTLQLQRADGRAARGELLVDQVFFASGRAQIRDEATVVLDAMAALLRGNASTRMTIEGHADERGFDTYNLDLSQRRAGAVADALVSRGIDRARLTTEPLGETEPVTPGYSATSLAQNRRVQFRLLRPRVTAQRTPDRERP